MTDISPQMRSKIEDVRDRLTRMVDNERMSRRTIAAVEALEWDLNELVELIEQIAYERDELVDALDFYDMDDDREFAREQLFDAAGQAAGTLDTFVDRLWGER